MMDRPDVMIHETAEVDDRATIGKNTKVWHHAQIRENVTVGKNCNIGKGVYLDFDVVIGDNCKLQNYISVYHGVKIGSNVFLGPHCVFTNDLYPRAVNDGFKVVETVVENGASIGANATIVCGIRIGENAMVGAGAVVTKDVPSNALVYGNPARVQGYVCGKGHRLKREKDGSFNCPVCGEVRIGD